MQRAVLIVTLIAFGALTGAAVWQHGYMGVFAAALHSLASMQIFVDLVIALSLFLAWMWRDAKATGRNPWPWLAITLVTGSFGPLVYLLTRETSGGASPR